jgi:L-rhamnose mutarotase
MIRKSFLMSVDPDKHREYEERHSPIWKELEHTLKEHGVHNYSIFLDEQNSKLFAYVEIESEERWTAVANTDICQKWWAHMKDIMPSNDDHSPKSKELRNVFHLP